jgi:hypothetical protein
MELFRVLSKIQKNSSVPNWQKYQLQNTKAASIKISAAETISGETFCKFTKNGRKLTELFKKVYSSYKIRFFGVT